MKELLRCFLYSAAGLVAVLSALYFMVLCAEAAEPPVYVQKEEDFGRIYVDDSPLSREMQDVIFDVCEENGAEKYFPYLMIALSEYESGGRFDCIGYTGDIGLMQINPKYAPKRMAKLGVTDLFDPEENALMGYDILQEAVPHAWSTSVLLMAYNEGIYPAIRHAREGKISAYARRIMRRYQEILSRVKKAEKKRDKMLKKKQAEMRDAFIRNYEVGCNGTAGASEAMARIAVASMAYVGGL